MAPHWSEIPDELIHMVAERLVYVDDSFRFGAVCKSWRSISLVNKEKQHVFAPMIMLAKPENDNLPTDYETAQGKIIRSFVIGGGVKNKLRRLDIELTKAQGRTCWGSPYGWLVTVGHDYKIHLLNPFTGVHIPLPPHPYLNPNVPLPPCLTPGQTIVGFRTKFVLGWNSSSSTQEGEFVVMSITGQNSLVHFTTCILPGNGTEATVAATSWEFIDNFCHDVIFYKGQIFMIDRYGSLSVADINQTPPQECQVDTLPKENKGDRFYLVEIAGCLHLVARFYNTTEHHVYVYDTYSFIVSRFNSRENRWYNVSNLGEYALFVGNHTSFSISTTTYPEFLSNSIYFTDDHCGLFRRHYGDMVDMGVYHCGDVTVEKFDFTNHGAFSKFSLPTFFMPAV